MCGAEKEGVGGVCEDVSVRVSGGHGKERVYGNERLKWLYR